MNQLIKVGILSILFIAVSCEDGNNSDETQPIQKESISGYVQKGPFINGTSISISELTSDLVQTGKTFSTQISDNNGSFELQQVELSSQYVELKADGFYFNETTGEVSTAQLTLYGLSDITDKSSLNVNIMSHLEKNRVSFLVSEGMEFDEAKQQAQSEILKIFSIEKSDIQASEMLDIAKEGDDNAVLLAVSLIIQGYRTDAELSELLANISTDIREDGELNSSTQGTALINHAKILDLSEIRENLVNRYDEMGVDATIPEFEKYIRMFIENTDYEFTGLIEYPEISDYGENVLFGDKTNYSAFTFYSLSANLPNGTELKIKLEGGDWSYRAMPNGPRNWTVSQYNRDNYSQVFTSTEPGVDCDLAIRFSPPSYMYDSTTQTGEYIHDSITISYYENMSELPTRIKKIVIEEVK